MFSHKCYSWFSHDVTKIHTKELLILLSFKRYYWTAPKHLCLNKVLVRKVSSFCDRGRPSKGHKHGVSIQSFINLDKTFFRISHIWNIARTWFLARPFAIYLILFPRFWTFCIEWLYIFHCYFSFTFFLTVCRLYRCRSAFIVASDWFVLPI